MEVPVNEGLMYFNIYKKTMQSVYINLCECVYMCWYVSVSVFRSET